MRNVIASIVIGPLLLISGMPTVADHSLSSNTPVQLAAGSDSTADRETYTRKARNDVREWQQRLADFSVKAEATGQSDAIAAKHDLNVAWTKTEAEASKLLDASAEDWENAKISYEKASRELADTWVRIWQNAK